MCCANAKCACAIGFMGDACVQPGKFTTAPPRTTTVDGDEPDLGTVKVDDLPNSVEGGEALLGLGVLAVALIAAGCCCCCLLIVGVVGFLIYNSSKSSSSSSDDDYHASNVPLAPYEPQINTPTFDSGTMQSSVLEYDRTQLFL